MNGHSQIGLHGNKVLLAELPTLYTDGVMTESTRRHHRCRDLLQQVSNQRSILGLSWRLFVGDAKYSPEHVWRRGGSSSFVPFPPWQTEKEPIYYTRCVLRKRRRVRKMRHINWRERLYPLWGSPMFGLCTNAFLWRQELSERGSNWKICMWRRSSRFP